jgi:uncharacterized protein YggE
VEPVQTPASEGRPPKLVGFKVVHSFTVLVRNNDPQRLGAAAADVLDTATESGANIVEQIVFFKEDEDNVRRQALTAAVEDALSNARALAAGAQVSVRDTIQIDGQPQYDFSLSNTRQNQLLTPEQASTPLVAGDLQVTCSVRVTCAF